MAFHQGQAPPANLDFPIVQPGVYHNNVGHGFACMRPSPAPCLEQHTLLKL